MWNSLLVYLLSIINEYKHENKTRMWQVVDFEAGLVSFRSIFGFQMRLNSILFIVSKSWSLNFLDLSRVGVLISP